jgi:hypothetical protein
MKNRSKDQRKREESREEGADLNWRMGKSSSIIACKSEGAKSEPRERRG